MMRDISLERIKSSISGFYGYDWDTADTHSDYFDPLSPGEYEAALASSASGSVLGKRARSSSSSSLSELPHKKARANDTFDDDEDEDDADVESDGESVIELSSKTRVFTSADLLDLLHAELEASMPTMFEAEDDAFSISDDGFIDSLPEDDNKTDDAEPDCASVPPKFSLRLSALKRMGLPLVTSPTLDLAPAQVPAHLEAPAETQESLPVPTCAPANPSPILGAVENTCSTPSKSNVGGDRGNGKADGGDEKTTPTLFPIDGEADQHDDDDGALFPMPESGNVFNAEIASPASSEYLYLDYSFPEDEKVEDAFTQFLADDAVDVKKACLGANDDDEHRTTGVEQHTRSRTVSSNRYGLDPSDAEDIGENEGDDSVEKARRTRFASSNRYGLDSDDEVSDSYDGENGWAGDVSFDKEKEQEHGECQDEGEGEVYCCAWKAAAHARANPPHKEGRHRHAFGTLGSEPMSRTPSLTYPS